MHRAGDKKNRKLILVDVLPHSQILVDEWVKREDNNPAEYVQSSAIELFRSKNDLEQQNLSTRIRNKGFIYPYKPIAKLSIISAGFLYMYVICYYICIDVLLFDLFGCVGDSHYIRFSETHSLFVSRNSIFSGDGSKLRKASCPIHLKDWWLVFSGARDLYVQSTVNRNENKPR